MKERHIVEENKNLQRDLHSKAIINTDSRAYRDYMNKQHAIKRRDEEIRDLKSEVDEIKKILNLILEKI